MATPKKLLDLVSQFHEHIDSYKSGSYNETQLRTDYLDPFFEELGWDMHNKLGYAEDYRDVIHEDQVKVAGAMKAPDYGFRIGGHRKFFLEAKKPSVSIKDDISPAYQLRRYAWSAKLPLSILSDFEEFAIYDCRIKPAPNDSASKGRILYCTYNDYAEKWDQIADIFSKNAVLKGSFDKFATTTKGKRGTAEVDEDFLATIERWRADLARNLALRNPSLTQRELNFAVQRVLDRIIFLRICEDRGIEEYQRLLKATEAKAVYPRLVQLFRQADDRYNSGLFHFKTEKGRHEEHDTLTPALSVDDALLKEIIRGLYYPDSPYEFRMLSADILGQVYEQFLGKVIRLTENHQAKVEEKPEVRKAGGVYYTPTYIVDYIVRQTVGKQIDTIEQHEVSLGAKRTVRAEVKKIQTGFGAGIDVTDQKMPKRVVDRVAGLRFLDPACGSGSFLIGAYQFLLEWHFGWYHRTGLQRWTKGKNPAVIQRQDGRWALSLTERKRILLDCIYGVDIDSQAVEVTKLSLLLKILEVEGVQAQQTLGLADRVLPDLGNNIKCGNSLINSDFYSQLDLPKMDSDAHLRINVFDWDEKDGFPSIMNAGGFDAVIGNPPYVNAWELFANMPEVRTYINDSNAFLTADRHWDLYILFLEKSLQLARKGGRVSFIIPYSFAIQKYGIALRKVLLDQHTIESIADLRTVRVFGKVPVITMIPVIAKQAARADHKISVFGPSDNATKYHPGQIIPSHQIKQKALRAENESMLRIDLTDEVTSICNTIEDRSVPVGDICFVNYGAQMSSREKGKFGKDYVLRDAKASSTCKKTVSGRNLYRYRVNWDGKWVEWALAEQMYGSRVEQFFEGPKIMVRDITGTHRLELTLDKSGLYCDHTILCVHRACDIESWRDVSDSSVTKSSKYSNEFLLGVLGSRLISSYYYWKLTGEGVRTGGGFHTYPKTIRQLLVFDLEAAGKSDFAVHDRIVNLVDVMLKLHPKRAAAKTPHERIAFDRQIIATDAQIDREVYALYGLTADEIDLVEAAT